jgi:Domain of unknown function (DUF4281)
MTADTLFSLGNFVATAAWLLLAAAPRRRWATLATGTFVPLMLSLAYFAVLALHWGEGRGSFASLRGVSELFSNDWVLLAGWIHYLAFDLLVGTLEARDAIEHGIPRWLLLPCLLLTFLFGPIGWLAYNAVRAGFVGPRALFTPESAEFSGSQPCGNG